MNKKKLNKLFKSSLCIFLTCIFVCLDSFVAYADFTGSSNSAGWEWHRVYSQDQFSKELNHLGGQGNSNGSDGWTRIMIIYDNDRYFVSGGGSCDDGYKYQGKSIQTRYAIEPDKDKFVTRTGLDTPWVRYYTYDGEHKCYRYYLRFASGEGLSDNVFGINMAWFGKKWYAAAYATYRNIPLSNPSSVERKHRGACNASVCWDWCFQWGRSYREAFGDDLSGLTVKQINYLLCIATGGWHPTNNGRYFASSGYNPYGTYSFVEADSDATFNKKVEYAQKWNKSSDNNDMVDVFDLTEKDYKDKYQAKCKHYLERPNDVNNDTVKITFNTEHSGVHDRTWNDDGGGAIDMCKNEDGSECSFKIFLGKPCAISAISMDYEVGPYISLRLDGYTITSGTILTVTQGSTLILDGNKNFLNGKIVVDGGTLVLKGYLQSDDDAKDGVDAKGNSFHCCDIDVRNHGTVIVDRDAVMLHRTPNAGIYLSGGSSMVVEGVLIVSNRIEVKEGSILRGMPGSFIGIGVSPKTTVDADKFTADYLKENRNGYIDGVADLRGGSIALSGQSSFISHGAVFTVGTPSVSNSFLDARISSNYYMKFTNMMRIW